MPSQLGSNRHHGLLENGRTIEAARALIARDWAKVGTLMNETHASLSGLYEVELSNDVAHQDLASSRRRPLHDEESLSFARASMRSRVPSST